MQDKPINIADDLVKDFGDVILARQDTQDSLPIFWLPKDKVHSVLQFLKTDLGFRTLYDLTAVDERMRVHREGQPKSDFSIVYHLLSYSRNEDVCIKVPLSGEYPTIGTITDIWPAANWYEREAWDMFGVKFEGHPNLRRILLPPTWEGHPLRKEHPARATEISPYELPDDRAIEEEQALQFNPEEWGMQHHSDNAEYMFLNLGPQHPGTHGVLRLALKLDGEVIVDLVPDIGYHHRGSEKMAERQTWHSYIPYTDRIDYLGGVMNNFSYVLAVEKLAGIVVPDRARVIRIMMAELFRIASHLVWYGTFAQDVGALSPVFYMFSDRERIFDIVEAITGGRMHPSWFRIGGVAQDLPQGWDRLVQEFVEYFPPRLKEYDSLVMRNRIFKARTKGIGAYNTDEAVEWGVTGPGLRATGMEWDFRKKRPYGGYDQFDFDIPIAHDGDCYGRASVRVEEMRQSLRIIQQCLQNMPAGDYKARHPLSTPPMKEYTMHDIETLITHFINVSWGPVIPPGEAFVGIEATKGNSGFYLISDGDIHPYRNRIRTPSFPHIQMLAYISRGAMIPDLVAILGSIDYVLADVDR